MSNENIGAECRQRKTSRSLQPSPPSRDPNNPARAKHGGTDSKRHRDRTRPQTERAVKQSARNGVNDDVPKPNGQPSQRRVESLTFEREDLIPEEVKERRRKLRAKQTEADTNLHQLMKNLKQEDGGVWMPKIVRQMTNTGDQAIVLAQILYWFDHGKEGEGEERFPRAGKWRHDKRWFYKTHRDFADEVGMKPRQVRACLQWLKDQGFIEVEYHLAQGIRTTFIHLNFETTFAAMREAYDARMKQIAE